MPSWRPTDGPKELDAANCGSMAGPRGFARALLMPWGLDGHPYVVPEEGGEGGVRVVWGWGSVKGRVRVLMGGLGGGEGEGGRGEGMWCY